MKLFISFILFLLSFHLHAQSMDLGYMEIEINKETGIIKTLFDFNPKSLGNPDLPFHQTLGRSFWKTGANRCQWKNTFTQVLSADQVKVGADAFCPEMKSDLQLDLSFLKYLSSYRIVGRILNDGIESTFVSAKNQRILKIAPQHNQSFGHFVYRGAEHIGATFKMSEGGDHLLFILALVFTGGSFIQIFKAITGFSLGHSISLLLATYGIITVPGNLIGPAIALSIIYIVLEGFVRKKYEHRFWLACILGLVHGFGLASALQGLHLSSARLFEALLAFNAGVELGQVMIIAMIVPLLFFIKKYSRYYRQFQRSSALLVLMVGCYWLVERTYLLKNDF